MGTKIEFHVLQSFPPANLNRDDTNAPKDCEFGGVRRARISSQCIKRSIRLHPDFAETTGVEPADRTRWLARDLKEELVKAGKSPEESQQVAIAFVSELLGGMDKSKAERSKVLFYVSAEEKQAITERLTGDWEGALEGKFSDLIKEYRKLFGARSSAPDIALFGRMLAEDPALNLDAACQVAHAISTHRVSMEMDFFTAVDDLVGNGAPGAAAESEQDSQLGAGMMGVTGYNSATFYRYAAIDWEQLLDNLGDEAGLARKTVQGFLRGLAKAVPTGKQNAFAAQTMPDLILCVLRTDGQAWSLANAFEKPVSPNGRGGGYLAGSAQALEKHWARLNKVYGDPQRPALAWALRLDDETPLESLAQREVVSLADLEASLLAALLGE